MLEWQNHLQLVAPIFAPCSSPGQTPTRGEVPAGFVIVIRQGQPDGFGRTLRNGLPSPVTGDRLR